MPTLSRVIFGWAGAPVVGPSASVFHCNAGDEATLIAAVNTFFNAVRGQFPTGITWSAPVSGETIDELSGHVNGAWSAGASGPVTSNGANTWANGVGVRVQWPTIGIVGGRHVVGATFLVPMMTSSYEGAGNITAAVLSTLNTAVVALGTTPNALRIYSRPAPGRGGSSYPTLTGQVPDKVSWLRSRRT